MNLEKLAIQGRTEVHKSMAASVSSQQLIAMRKNALKNCFEDFFSHDHRLEYVASIHNVEFIDDSKANNINATWYSLETMNTPVIWLTFAAKDDSEYKKLMDLVRKKVKAIICIGNDSESTRGAFASVVKNVVDMPTINDAVQFAFNISKRGDTVLFSPMCSVKSDTDQSSIIGDEFRNAVNKI